MNKIQYIILSIISLLVLLPTQFTYAGFFVDVSEDHPYYDAITYLQNHGIIEGYSDQSFRPDQKINRAETLKILLLGSNIDINESVETGGFFDIPTDTWFAPYVLKAKQLGIVQGNPDGSFAPERTVNLAESTKMIINTNSFSIDKEISNRPFSDVPENSWHAPYFEYGKNSRFFTVESFDNIYPEQEMTRGYLAFLMYRAIIHKKTSGRDTEYASYYSDKFNGRTTASGEVFNNDELTAAHKTLPFGTKVRAININNGKSVIVTITDRGPYSPNRVLDLTTRAFEKIGSLGSGILPVVYEVIDENGETSFANAQSCTDLPEKKIISADFFDNITLKREVPNIFVKNEIYIIEGKLEEESQQSSITASVFQNESQVMTINEKLDQNNEFRIPIHFTQAGTFSIALIPGVSGNSKIHTITVEEGECNNTVTENSSEPIDIQFTIIDNIAKIQWKNDSSPLTKIRISDGNLEKFFIINGNEKEFIVPTKEFEEFSEGSAFIEVASAQSDSIFSIDRSSTWNYADKIAVTLTKHHFGEHKIQEIHVSSFSYSHFPQGTISFKGVTKTKTLPHAIIILPNGFTTEINLVGNKALEKDSLTGVDFFPAETEITLSYPTQNTGTYIVGIYNSSGEAVFNYPSYDTNEKPILPDFLDLNEREFESLIYNEDKQTIFTLINQDRKNLGLSELEMHDNLNELAQSRSDDMVERDYFGHITPNGTDVNTLRLLYNVKTPLKENIAKDVSVEFGHALLMRSPKHRSALLDPDITRLGIGLAQHADGTIIITELFSADPIDNTRLPEIREDILSNINTKRLENNKAELTLSGVLTPIAQQWSDQMATDNFCEGENIEAKSINDEIEANGGNVTGGLSRFVCNTDFNDAISAIVEHESTLSTEFNTIGIGITQDNYGIIRFTIISAQSSS